MLVRRKNGRMSLGGVNMKQNEWNGHRSAVLHECNCCSIPRPYQTKHEPAPVGRMFDTTQCRADADQKQSDPGTLANAGVVS